MSLSVTTTPEADAQIRTIDDWWRENRPASPSLFFDELSSAFELIAHAPNIGRFYRRSPIVGTRRILLRGSRHHVFYVASEREVTVPVPQIASTRAIAARYDEAVLPGAPSPYMPPQPYTLALQKRRQQGGGA